jgi:hypothetical protein
MKNLLTIFMVMLCASLLSQTPNPYIEDFTSVGGVGEWTNVNGQSNTGSHNGELCYNIVGTYLDDEYYSYESPTLDLNLWSQVDVEFTIASNLRAQDEFTFWYFDGTTSIWSGYNISGLVGTYTVTIPTTTTKLSFDLSTFSNGNLNGKYAHVDQITLTDPFVVLPVELLYFSGREVNNTNTLEWATASEYNADYFEIEWSEDGSVWWPIGDVAACGWSSSEIAYTFKHEDYKPQINYYRLSQYDFDGAFEVFDIIAIDNSKTKKRIVKYVSLSGQEIDPSSTTGLVFGIYSDGTSIKLYLQ